MVRVTDELALSPDTVTVYHASDPLLGHLPVLIFHGASTTSNYTLNSSRVQIHVFSPAGLQSFPRLTISPNSPFYASVSHLPREFQGDEVYRALAFGLSKYFAELPDGVKTYLKNAYPTRGRRPGSGQPLFGEQHVADLVQAMVKSDNTANIINSLQQALQTQHISNIDIDMIFPPGAIVPLRSEELEEVPDNDDDMLDPTLRQYGGYKPLVRLFGESIFLPTTRLRRAPSKPTSLNKTKSFSAEQKVDLRMKLAELVDTEERYVLKLNELVHTVAAQYKETTKAKDVDGLSSAEKELDTLFQQSAAQILSINSGFLRELRKVMDDSEEEAIKDMETTTTNLAPVPGVARPRDPTGALTMAKLFLEWFPKFSDCYQDYIKASRHFPTILHSLIDPQASLQQRGSQAADQSTRSTLIEPVQRLPRYSLLIDQIVSCVPMTHPALQSMLKARDVITNICSLDDPSSDKPQVVSRLRGLIEAWPVELEPQGRLITAADFIELSPPFQLSLDMTENGGILLLFTDCVVVLKKLGGGMSGRDLLREIDKPSATELLISMTNAAGGQAAYEFVFTGWHSLSDLRFTESSDGNLIWMTSTQAMKGAHTGEHKVAKSATARCFMLQDSFEGKATKWGEDVVKARIEARFSEAEREDPCWTLRSVRNADSQLGLHAAIFQEGADQLVEGRKEPAAVRIVVDHERGTKGAPVGHYGVEIVVDVNASDMKQLSILTVGLNGQQHQDEVAVEDFLQTITHRIVQLLSTQFSVSNRDLTAAMVSYYTKTLRSLSFTASATRAEKTRSFLATSPVKLFSSLWNGGTAPTPDSVVSGSKQQPRLPSLHRTNSYHSVQGSIRGRDDRSFVEEGLPDNPLMRLEQTFAGFLTALQMRKGTIQGRTLLNRHNADEVMVNDLYNRLIENPFDVEISPDVGVDIVFVAFENFLRIAWKEQMGQVITMQSLDTLLDRANRRAPGDFGDFVHYLFADMAPQNRRAFGNIIKLLDELLDGCANDGDRGAMTLAFSELVVTNGRAHDYINLLDRLVEECPRIFGDSPNQSFNFGNSVAGSVHSTFKDKSMTGSVTSNASSLRRKFGLDMLLRPKEKEEKQERPSVWRSLSRHRNPATGEPSSLSKGTVHQARAIDDSSLQRRMLRGGHSPTRPPVAGAFEDPQRPGSSQRPVSSHRMEFPLNTIGEPNETVRKSSKKKRRSSLSDLKTLMAAASIEDEPLPALQATKQTSEKVNSGPKPASPSRIPVNAIPQGFKVPPPQKENVAEPSREGNTKTEEPVKVQMSPTKNARHSKGLSTSSIPTLKPGRPGTAGADSPTRPSSPTRPGGKLRLQSPQKLRERLQTEKKAAEESSAALQSELSKIGSDMAQLSDRNMSNSQSSDLKQLTAAVKALEEKIPSIAQEMQDKQATLQKEMDTTVRAAEAKLRAIDQLHKEVTAENELLYEKFNDELGRIVKALRGKGKDEKELLMTKLKDQSEETARLTKENARLKREIVSLKTALKGGDQ